MKSNIFSRIEENKGITLMVLVITIIVILILAAITISTLQNSGLIGRTKEARDKYNNSVSDEMEKLAGMAPGEWAGTYYLMGDSTNVDLYFVIGSDDTLLWCGTGSNSSETRSKKYYYKIEGSSIFILYSGSASGSGSGSGSYDSDSESGYYDSDSESGYYDSDSGSGSYSGSDSGRADGYMFAGTLQKQDDGNRLFIFQISGSAVFAQKPVDQASSRLTGTFSGTRTYIDSYDNEDTETYSFVFSNDGVNVLRNGDDMNSEEACKYVILGDSIIIDNEYYGSLVYDNSNNVIALDLTIDKEVLRCTKQ